MLWCKRKPALVATVTISLVLIVGLSAYLIRVGKRTEVERLVQGLLQADTNKVESIILDIEPYRNWASQELRTHFAESDDGTNAKLHAGMALFAEDPTMLPYLRQQLLEVDADQFFTVLSVIKSEEGLAEHFDAL